MNTLSESELSSLLMRAIRGLGLPYGDYENTAEMLQWAVMHGCVSWETFDQALRRIEQTKMKLMPPRDQGKFDLKGGSLSVYGAQIGDYCASKALHHDAYTCLIQDSQDCAFIGYKLVEAMRLGLYGFALWSTDDSVYSYYTESIKKPPQLCIWSKKGEDLEHAVIVITNSAQHTARLFSRHWSRPIEFARETLSPEDLMTRYEKHLADGVAVPPAIVYRLEKHAAKLLVPNSEQSQQGAGARNGA